MVKLQGSYRWFYCNLELAGNCSPEQNATNKKLPNTTKICEVYLKSNQERTGEIVELIADSQREMKIGSLGLM